MAELIGRSWQVLGHLGVHARCEVFTVRDGATGRVATVRHLCADASSEERRSFEEEFRAGVRLAHPNVLQAYEYGLHEGRPYVVGEFARGGTLRELLSRGLGLGDGLELLAQVAEAIAAAHALSLAHGRLRSERVLLTNRETAKVGGFVPADAFARPARDLRALGAMLRELAKARPPAHDGEQPGTRAAVADLGATLLRSGTGDRAMTAGEAARRLRALPGGTTAAPALARARARHSAAPTASAAGPSALRVSTISLSRARRPVTGRTARLRQALAAFAAVLPLVLVGAAFAVQAAFAPGRRPLPSPEAGPSARLAPAIAAVVVPPAQPRGVPAVVTPSPCPATAPTAVVTAPKAVVPAPTAAVPAPTAAVPAPTAAVTAPTAAVPAPTAAVVPALATSGPTSLLEALANLERTRVTSLRAADAEGALLACAEQLVSVVTLLRRQASEPQPPAHGQGKGLAQAPLRFLASFCVRSLQVHGERLPAACSDDLLDDLLRASDALAQAGTPPALRRLIGDVLRVLGRDAPPSREGPWEGLLRAAALTLEGGPASRDQALKALEQLQARVAGSDLRPLVLFQRGLALHLRHHGEWSRAADRDLRRLVDQASREAPSCEGAAGIPLGTRAAIALERMWCRRLVLVTTRARNRPADRGALRRAWRELVTRSQALVDRYHEPRFVPLVQRPVLAALEGYEPEHREIAESCVDVIEAYERARL